MFNSLNQTEIELPRQMAYAPLVCRYLELASADPQSIALSARLVIATCHPDDPTRQSGRVGCRYLLQRLLAAMSTEPHLPRKLVYADSGAPRLAPEDTATGLNISMAHSANWLAVGISQGSKIGVDVEQVAPRSNMKAISEFLSWNVPVEDCQDFYANWTLWEASAKCIEGSAVMSQNHGFEQLKLAGFRGRVVTSGCWSGMQDVIDEKAHFAVVLKSKKMSSLVLRNLDPKEIM